MSNKLKRRREKPKTKKTPPVRPHKARSKSIGSPSLRGSDHPFPFREETGKRAAKASRGSVKATLSHQECESMLEFYISAETRGENAEKVYPAVAQHLAVCDLCRTSYLLVKDAPLPPATEKAVKQDQPSAQPLPFLPTYREGDAWKTLVRSPIGGAPIGFGFAIQPAHVRATLSPSTGLALRGEPPPEEGALLLADTVPLGQRQVMVEMRTARSQDPGLIAVRVSMVASAPLPDPIQAILTWNREQRSAVVEDGKCSFDEIPVSAVEDAGNISIEFRAGEGVDQAT